MDLIKTCRICCESEGTLDIFDDSGGGGLPVSALMMYCSARLSVTRGDELPAAVCVACEAELRATYRLVRRCEDADARLRAARDRVEPGDGGDRESDPPSERLAEEASEKSKRPGRGRGRRARCEPAALTCASCGLRSAHRAAHAAHARSHARLAPPAHACALCDKRYRDAGSLRRHAARHHAPPGARRRDFTCEACGKGFYSRGDLVVHLRTHTGETPYRCAQCGARFTQASALLRHARRHAGLKPHACPAPACPKRFCTRDEARHHLRAHSDERPFRCPVCAAPFKYRNNLRKHALLHEAAGRGRFVCAECGRAFSQAGNLRGHAARRHGAGAGAGAGAAPQPRPCPAAAAGCARTFGSGRALARHLSHAHAPRVEQACERDGCGRQFLTRGALRHHELRAHSGAVPFPCARCDRPFYRRNDLARHMIATHKERLAP